MKNKPNNPKNMKNSFRMIRLIPLKYEEPVIVKKNLAFKVKPYKNFFDYSLRSMIVKRTFLGVSIRTP